MSGEKSEFKAIIDNVRANNVDERVTPSVQTLDSAAKNANKIQRKLRIDCNSLSKKSCSVFSAKTFSFSKSFPKDRVSSLIVKY